MKEEWRDILGYEGRYQVSNFGRVCSVERCYFSGPRQICVPKRMMSLQKHYRGYLFVHLRKPKERKKFFVHRLVAMAFLPNSEEKMVVNHLNRDKQHNHITNLEWATHQENSDHWVADDAEHSDMPF